MTYHLPDGYAAVSRGSCIAAKYLDNGRLNAVRVGTPVLTPGHSRIVRRRSQPVWVRRDREREYRAYGN